MTISVETITEVVMWPFLSKTISYSIIMSLQLTGRYLRVAAV